MRLASSLTVALALATAAAVGVRGLPAWPQQQHDAQNTGLLSSTLQPVPSAPLPLTNLSIVQFSATFPANLALTELGYVIGIGEAKDDFQQGVVYAANLFDTADPIVWQTQNISFIGSPSTTSPVVGEDLLYVTMSDGSQGIVSECCMSVLALNVKTGAIVWDSQKTYQPASMVVRPTLSPDGTILYGLTQPDYEYADLGPMPTVLLALDPQTGVQLFNVSLANETSIACDENGYLGGIVLGAKGHIFLSCSAGLIHLQTPSEEAITAAADAAGPGADRRKFMAPTVTWMRHGNPETGPSGPYWSVPPRRSHANQ